MQISSVGSSVDSATLGTLSPNTDLSILKFGIWVTCNFSYHNHICNNRYNYTHLHSPASTGYPVRRPS